MRPLTTEIRQKYLAFFQEHGHAVIPGASLIPENDPTVLFTTAGMHPLVPYLLGEPHPAGRRLCDVQRCIRTQDIDEVGDASHLTFFEMLGNWSLGDYFKEGAIQMSFEFLTAEKWLGISREMLAVTCFGGDKRFPALPRDEEAAKIWKKMGIPEERIAFMEGGVRESKQNWWGPAGQSGPCGPDTEMFYWIGHGKPQGNPATHEAEWLEIWNDVFMQYNKTKEGTFEPLKQQNVDTGMGLERAETVMQGKKSVYETDRMKPIMDTILNLAVSTNRHAASQKAAQGDNSELNRYARIITDHLKAATFIIADGVTPSNIEQGYVLRRIIRRAIRAQNQIDMQFADSISAHIVSKVIEQYSVVYKHIQDNKQKILNEIIAEEEKFLYLLEGGEKKFQMIVKNLIGNSVDGKSAFHLYDTFGFPLELTKELAQECHLSVDENGFKKAFEEHQKLSRAGAEQKFKGGLQDHSDETTKLHTATHLLNAALRTVLGDHVFQKGSNITAERLRFDFSHPDKMTPAQITEVERLVNKAIKDDLSVSYHVTTVEGAKREGAIGIFDARYGSEVKVYAVGNEKKGVFSKEICGGPHVAHTGMLGSFKILKEESSSSGVRRIKAVISGGPETIETAKESAA